PILNKIEDLELSDLAFAHGRSKVLMDTNIVIVNCRGDDRHAIAEKITLTDSCRAKVIAIDIIFDNREDSGTAALQKALFAIGDRVVMARDTSERVAIDTAIYRGHVAYGYMSLKENLLKTKREFVPYVPLYKDTVVPAFATAILQKYNASLLDTVDSTEPLLINFRQSHSDTRYLVLNTVDDIRNFRNSIAGAIVILGAWDSASLEDRHYTPLNGHLGRSWPDMNGAEYHAQVLSMFIDNDFLSQPKKPGKFVAILLLSIIWIWYIGILHQKPKVKYLDHFLAELSICGLTVISIGISVLWLNSSNHKIEPLDYLVPVYISGLFSGVACYFYNCKSH
ncbi:MAG: CHASE2 domain-containing protein, partial [Taibaiella sp.]|nr:CHASE2 domain-containing protein [Taibaiella sp.]